MPGNNFLIPGVAHISVGFQFVIWFGGGKTSHFSPTYFPLFTHLLPAFFPRPARKSLTFLSLIPVLVPLSCPLFWLSCMSLVACLLRTFSLLWRKEKVPKRKRRPLLPIAIGTRGHGVSSTRLSFGAIRLHVACPPIVYQRLSFYAGLSSVLQFSARQPHLRHNKGAIMFPTSRLLSTLFMVRRVELIPIVT